MLFRWLNYIVGILSVRLEGNHNLKQAIDNSGWLLFDKALRMGINLVISVLMARKLGPTQYGQLSYAFSLVALFSPIAALGLEGIVVRNLIMGKDPPSLILGNAIILRLIGSILAIFLSNFTIIWIEPTNSLTRELVLFASLGFIFQCSDVFEMWFQSKVESKYTVKAKLPSLFLFFIFRIVLIVSLSSLTAFAYAQSLEALMSGICLLLMYRLRVGSLRRWHTKINYAFMLLKESWPLILAGLSVILYMRLDIIMLENMSGQHAVGIYSAATRISEGFYFLPMIIMPSVASLILKSKDIGTEAYNSIMFKMYVFMARISLAIAVILTVLSTWLVNILYGEFYQQTSLVLQIHVWAIIAVFLGVANSHFLNNEGLQRLSLYRTVAGLVINTTLNVWLIPKYNAVGAAIATLLSYYVATFSTYFSAKNRHQSRLMLKSMLLGIEFHFGKLKS